MKDEAKSPIEIEWGLCSLHNKLLEALVYIDEFCADHEIEYCLAYGSALGAKRHSGFIPWDDDADIYMDVDNYIKFKKLFQKDGDKVRYYLQEYGEEKNTPNLGKLRINGTTYIESDVRTRKIHHGLYIDIFVLHKTEKRRVWLKKLSDKVLSLKRLSDMGYNRRKRWRFVLGFLKLFPRKIVQRIALYYLCQDDKGESSLLFDTEYKASHQAYDRAMLFPAIRIKYENVELNAPRKLDRYLRIIYGEYMKLPSLEQVNWLQHAEQWDVDNDFSEYINHRRQFCDEELL